MTCNGTFDDAKRLIKKYGTRDPFEIIASIPNMTLWVTENFSADGLKGFATIKNREKYIVVNGLLVPEEQRVVAGHELGHIIRHEARLRVQTMQDFDVYGATGKLEREANFFAADLLMDDEEVMDEISSSGADFFSVAKQLGVPAPFFAFKLYSLIERGERLRLPVDLNNTFLRAEREK